MPPPPGAPRHPPHPTSITRSSVRTERSWVWKRVSRPRFAAVVLGSREVTTRSFGRRDSGCGRGAQPVRLRHGEDGHHGEVITAPYQRAHGPGRGPARRGRPAGRGAGGWGEIRPAGRQRG